jgi:hypothetical protein
MISFDDLKVLLHDAAAGRWVRVFAAGEFALDGSERMTTVPMTAAHTAAMTLVRNILGPAPRSVYGSEEEEQTHVLFVVETRATYYTIYVNDLPRMAPDRQANSVRGKEFFTDDVSDVDRRVCGICIVTLGHCRCAVSGPGPHHICTGCAERYELPRWAISPWQTEEAMCSKRARRAQD